MALLSTYFSFEIYMSSGSEVIDGYAKDGGPVVA